VGVLSLAGPDDAETGFAVVAADVNLRGSADDGGGGILLCARCPRLGTWLVAFGNT